MATIAAADREGAMDYQKKKLLTQSVSLIQANLTLTSETLEVFKSADILTQEEVITIEKDEMSSGKVVELVCMLKRKDNRTFSRFLAALEDMHVKGLVEVFKHKASPSDVMTPDPRAYQYLENELTDTPIGLRKIKDIAVNLVMRQAYEDDVKQLNEQVAYLQRQLKARSSGPTDILRVSESDSFLSTPPSAGRKLESNERVSKTLTAQQGELITILKQKDDIIRKKDDEYAKLRQILGDTQSDLHAVLELNNQYLTIISQLNTLQMNGVTPRAENSQALMDMEKRLEESEQKVKHLEVELGGITEELDTTERELERVLGRELKYKSMLDLDPDADDNQVEARLEELKKEGSVHKLELDKIRMALEKTSKDRLELESTVTSLTREKEKISFHMRQQELTIKKMKRMRNASSTISAAEAVISAGTNTATQLRLPSIDRPGSTISLQAINKHRTHQYCMFCRQEYQPLKSNLCRVHFRPIRQGKWTCCNDDCHRSIGCLQMPHFYMEITVDKKLFITDGARYMEVS